MLRSKYSSNVHTHTSSVKNENETSTERRRHFVDADGISSLIRNRHID